MAANLGLSMSDSKHERHVKGSELRRCMLAILQAAGADLASSQAVTRALSTASAMGTDSHGLRLLPHYVAALEGGRINPTPCVTYHANTAVAGRIDADNGFGHLATYEAINHAVAMAKELGLGAVTIGNSSHFGAAGVYALAAAEEGLMAMVFSHSDSFVLPFGGVQAFHGTNPIAFAAPVRDSQPYLFDMATSAVPWNRVEQYRAIGRQLPEQVAADKNGGMTIEPDEVAALLPLGGQSFGFKGMGLASVVEILSATLSGMANGSRLIPMIGDDMHTARKLGHFVVAIDPRAFLDETQYFNSIAEYLSDLRAQQSSGHTDVLAPGDREWQCHAQRTAQGIPLDSANQQAYQALANRFDIPELDFID